MNSIFKWSGVVALVILAILVVGKYTGTSTVLGSATNCTDGYTCFTNLETQGNSIVDGTASLIGALTGTSASFSGAVTTGTFTQNGGITATTSTGTVTFTAANIATASVINHTNAGATTLTLPASTTLSSFVPTAGQCRQIFYINSGTAIDTLAGGTGTLLATASSTITHALKTVKPSGVALIIACRKANTDVQFEMVPAL